MATRKVSVTLEADTLSRARELVGPRGLSAFVESAVRSTLDDEERRAAFLAYLDEVEAADPTDEVTARRGRNRAVRIRGRVEG